MLLLVPHRFLTLQIITCNHLLSFFKRPRFPFLPFPPLWGVRGNKINLPLLSAFGDLKWRKGKEGIKKKNHSICQVFLFSICVFLGLPQPLQLTATSALTVILKFHLITPTDSSSVRNTLSFRSTAEEHGSHFSLLLKEAKKKKTNKKTTPGWVKGND